MPELTTPADIGDYALIGDTQSAALVSTGGSIDWLCVPSFDSPACFAALLGDERNGRWLLRPDGEVRRSSRRYRGDTLVLETTHETDEGAVMVVDCMPPRENEADVVRLVRGLRGRVRMCMEIVIRFDYGSVVPWVRRTPSGLSAVAGPDALELHSRVELEGRDERTYAGFEVREGDEIAFSMVWHEASDPAPAPLDPGWAIAHTERYWEEWASSCRYTGRWRDAVMRSLITLKALTFAPTGAITAAATTSLPEWPDGARNWDYRMCWLRDATFTLLALLDAGFEHEAVAWRDWLMRVVAGRPSELQIMYGLRGERRLTELELDWLPGYRGASPVRVGNAASDQFQLDVYGEVTDLLYQSRSEGMRDDTSIWPMERAVIDFLESGWREPDEGIWEVRGPRRHFTHSKVMAWVAFDRAIRDVERFGLEGPADRWRSARDEIKAEVLERGFDAEAGSFMQSYGSSLLDASLLMIPLVGFLPAEDERVLGTIAAIERRLLHDGFVYRYEHDPKVDGLSDKEASFLACTFWYADCLNLVGRRNEAEATFERALGVRNDVGLLAEQYEPSTRTMLGNFPQALSHVCLIDTAHNLTAGPRGPAERRRHPVNEP